MKLSKEILKQINSIQIKANYLASDALAGEYSSAFKGLGQEFEKVREYDLGDDVRSIDWNVTARMNSTFVKVFKEEREMTLLLMVDISSSQYFGTTGKFKQEVAAELAAILALVAVKKQDKVGLILFSDRIEQFIPPKKGRAHIWHLIRSVLSYKRQGQKTDIEKALSFMLQVTKRKAMVFLISDFLSDNYQKVMKISARKHDLVCALIEDDRERNLPNLGVVEFEDAESGKTYLVDTGIQTIRNKFTENFEEERNQLWSFFRRHHIDAFSVGTQTSSLSAISKFFKRREKRLNR